MTRPDCGVPLLPFLARLPAVVALVLLAMPPHAARSSSPPSVSEDAPSHVTRATLSYLEAVENTLVHNPELARFAIRQRGLEGSRAVAALGPALEFQAEVENFAGSGELGWETAEITLSLSSVLELGGKSASRTGVIDAQSRYLDTEARIRALDVIGQLSQHFISLLSLQAQRALARQSEQLAADTVAMLTTRAEAGASPHRELLRARAALDRAALTRRKLQRQVDIQRYALALQWGAERPAFEHVRGDLYQQPNIIAFDDLARALNRNPRIEIYAASSRLQQARIDLSEAQASADIRWSFGVRHFESNNDQGLVAGFSMPLFASQRSRGERLSARAELEDIALQQLSARQALQQTLLEAYQLREYQREALQSLDDNILPALEQVLEETRRGFENGRYDYRDWQIAQQELLETRLTRIEAATELQRYSILIEQLSGESAITSTLKDQS